MYYINSCLNNYVIIQLMILFLPVIITRHFVQLKQLLFLNCIWLLVCIGG